MLQSQDSDQTARFKQTNSELQAKADGLKASLDSIESENKGLRREAEDLKL